jgi:hypothetical protein
MSLELKFRETLCSKNLAIVGVAIFLVGAGFRLSQYIAIRSLWVDEAMLALNIRELSG